MHFRPHTTKPDRSYPIFENAREESMSHLFACLPSRLLFARLWQGRIGIMTVGIMGDTVSLEDAALGDQTGTLPRETIYSTPDKRIKSIAEKLKQLSLVVNDPIEVEFNLTIVSDINKYFDGNRMPTQPSLAPDAPELPYPVFIL